MEFMGRQERGGSQGLVEMVTNGMWAFFSRQISSDYCMNGETELSPRTEYEYRTDAYGDTRTDVIYRSRASGHSGRWGSPGRPAWTYLTPGSPGANGIAEIKVIKNDQTNVSYSDRYRIIVDSFSVVDENNDGINEPGEYLIVKNILVSNRGK